MSTNPVVENALRRIEGNRLPYPYWINIENTLRCNLRCPMCMQYIDGTTVTGQHMPFEVYQRIADQLFPHVQRVCWSVAGEPTLAPDFEKFLDVAGRYPIKSEVVTNATLLHRGNVLPKLMETLELFQVSLDGATRETYERIRVGGKWDKTIANLRAFQRARMRKPASERPRFYLIFVLMESNVHELPLFVDLAKALGADRVESNHMMVFDETMEQQSLLQAKARANHFFAMARRRSEQLGIGITLPPDYKLSEAEAAEADFPIAPEGLEIPADDAMESGASGDSPSTIVERPNLFRRILGRFGPEKVIEAPPVEISPLTQKHESMEKRRLDEIASWEVATGLRNTCDYLWGKAYFSAGGDVSPCCMPGRPLVGSIMEQTFDEIWNGEALNRMRAHLSTNHPYHCCAHCSLFRDSLDPDDEAIWDQAARADGAFEVTA